MRIKLFLIISLLLNAYVACYFFYKKREAIKAMMIHHPAAEKGANLVASKKELSAMNNEKMELFTDTANKKTGPPFKILVIGNSLSYHPAVKEIGWTHTSGMAATKLSNDYPHVLFKKTEGLLPDRKIELRITNLVNFERNFQSFNIKTIDSLKNYKADVIVFQLGENVFFNTTNMTADIFEQKYTLLINSFKKSNNPVIICTLPFFPSEANNTAIENVALNTQSYLVDLSHLALLSNQNLAKDEANYKGDRKQWKASGIGLHPGDVGMQNIADAIFTVINANIPTK